VPARPDADLAADLAADKGGRSVTHEAKPGLEPFDELPDAMDVETLPFEEFLARFPDDRPDDDELVSRAIEAGRG
jgi:hypothetical protein